jgi:cytochrome b involved in lipid metabolism
MFRSQAINGRVYDLTEYLPFHPGGQPVLLEFAGKDATQAILETHAWININAFVSKCCIGALE